MNIFTFKRRQFTIQTFSIPYLASVLCISYLFDENVLLQAGEKVLPAEVDDGIREYLCIKAYLVRFFLCGTKSNVEFVHFALFVFLKISYYLTRFIIKIKLNYSLLKLLLKKQLNLNEAALKCSLVELVLFFIAMSSSPFVLDYQERFDLTKNMNFISKMLVRKVENLIFKC